VPNNIKVAITILTTVRGVGLYALVNGTIYFAPRDLVDSMMDDLVSDGDPYSKMRGQVYRVCALLPSVLSVSALAEVDYALRDRIVALRSVDEAREHWLAVRTSFEEDGLRGMTPRHDVFGGVASSAPMDVLSSRPPSAISMTPEAGEAPQRGRAEVKTRRTGETEVVVEAIEIVPLLGTYAHVGGQAFYASTRTMAVLTREYTRTARTMRDYADAVTRGLADLPLRHEEIVETQREAPFSRRLSRFASNEAAVAHRTRLAALYLLPASKRLTRSEDVRHHYTAGSTDPDWHLRAVN